ncbi:hypothetical protein Tco_0057004, partial [Tanacetum coccineum]
GQYDSGFIPGPLCLLSIWLGQGPNVMVWHRPKGLLYLLYVIKSPQSSIFAACGVVLRAVNITRLWSFSVAPLPSSVAVGFFVTFP